MTAIHRGLDRRIWQMAFARAISTMGLSLVMVYLSIYMVEVRGLSAWLNGLILLAANLGQSLTNAWAGDLSDRIGRRPLIVSSMFLRAAVIAVLGAQVTLHAPLWSLALNIIVSSASRGCFEPVAYALVADVARDDQRVAAYGIQRMGTNLGWAIGPVLGGLLTLIMPYGAVFYVGSAALIAAGILTLRVVDPPRKSAAPARQGELIRALASGLSDRVIQMLLIGTFLCALLETQMFTTLSIYLTRKLSLQSADLGLMYAVNGIGVLLLQVPALGLIRRLGIRRTLPWSSAFDTLGFVVIGFISGLPGAIGAMSVLTLAEVLFDPSQQTAIAEVADPARRGRTFGVAGFIQTIGIAVAPVLGGVLLDTISDHRIAMWLGIATIGCAQTACFALFVRRRAAPGGTTPGALAIR